MRRICLFIWIVLSVFSTSLMANAQQSDVTKNLKEIVDRVGCEKADQAFQNALNQAVRGTIEREKVVINYASCLIKTKKCQEAVNLLNKEVIYMKEKPFMAYASLGGAYLCLERDADAAQSFEESIRLNPTPGIFGQICMIHYRMAGEASHKMDWVSDEYYLRKAEDECRRAIALSRVPYPVYHGGLAHVLGAQKRYDEALAEFNKAIDLVPSLDWNNTAKDAALADYYVGLGSIHARKGEREKAKELIQKGIEKAPTLEFKRHLEIIGDIALNPAKDKEEIERRYPELKGKRYFPEQPFEAYK